MDKCNYPLDGIYPCLKETQLCLCAAEISGSEFSLSKEKFRGGKKPTVWKSLCKPENSLFQDATCKLCYPVEELDTSQEQLPPCSSFPQQCQGSLKASILFPAHFPSPPASVGPSLSSLPQFHMEISSTKGERSPCPDLKGSWKAAQVHAMV